ncbi:MAG: S-layer homology domain-containing protein [Firmicutes bacterium HGW-Firmicutes-1]|jgi:hypothetical protein|nr:MAG: S-layer homology domain-containing protein [Firmicutes bacterium HGW-Firmicutes-1]
MKRKIKVLLLTIVLAIQFSSIGLFAATEEEIYTGNQLSVLGILKGYSDGSLKLDSNITRAEVATLTVRILGYENTVVVGEEKSFTDVNKSFWGYSNVQNAFKLKVMQGYPSGEFKPGSDITYAEVVAIMVNALGKGKDLEGNWPDNYLNKGKALGIIPSNSTVTPNKIVTRGEMAVIVWSTLMVKP